MDQYAISLLLLGEGALLAITLSLLVAGGLIAARIFNVQVVFRRVVYLWCLTGLLLGISLSQLIWLLAPAAAEHELLWLVATAGLGCSALFGAGLYYSSAGRSNDIKGDTSSAWLGFVPLANLYLVFAGSDRVDIGDSPTRGALARYVLDPILVIGALAVVATSQAIDRTVQGALLEDGADDASIGVVGSEATSVEERFAREARLSGASLPIRIDEMTVLSSIEAKGQTLRLIYDVETEISGFRSDFEEILAEQQCRPEMFGSNISRGGTVEMVYQAPGGEVIEVYAITQADCIK